MPDFSDEVATKNTSTRTPFWHFRFGPEQRDLAALLLGIVSFFPVGITIKSFLMALGWVVFLQLLFSSWTHIGEASRRSKLIFVIAFIVLVAAPVTTFLFPRLIFEDQTKIAAHDAVASSAPTIEPQPPSLHQLFATDLRPPNSLMINGYYLVPIENRSNGMALNAVVSYTVFYDTISNTRYPSYYVPHLDGISESARKTVRTIRAIAGNYLADMEAASRGVSAKVTNAGDESDAIDTRNFKFSGKVYVYHEDLLTVSQQNDLIRLFQAGGSDLVLRGLAYASTVYESIRAGDATPPPLAPHAIPSGLGSSAIADCQHREIRSVTMHPKSVLDFVCRSPMVLNRTTQQIK